MVGVELAGIFLLGGEQMCRWLYREGRYVSACLRLCYRSRLYWPSSRHFGSRRNTAYPIVRKEASRFLDGSFKLDVHIPVMAGSGCRGLLLLALAGLAVHNP